MAVVEIVFEQPRNPASSPVDLVFGDGGVLPPADIHADISGRVTGFRAAVGAHTVVSAAVGGRITGFRAVARVEHDINVQRPLARITRSTWQSAECRSNALQGRFEQAQKRAQPTLQGWQQAERRMRPMQGRFEQAGSVGNVYMQAFQQAQRLGVAPVLQWYQSAVPLRNVRMQRFEDAQPTTVVPTQSRFEDALRRNNLKRLRYEDAAHIGTPVASSFGHAVRWSRALQVRYEQARKPGPGKTKPTQPPLPEPCYVPSVPAHLVFIDQANHSLPAHLVFACERKRPPGPEPEPPQYVIPVLEVYMSVHHINAVLLPSMEPVTLAQVDIEADDDSFGWSFSASGGEHLLDQLAPVSGLPAQIRITVDGIDWVFAVERISRTRRFNEHRVSIDGRSVTALLGGPYSRAQTWLNEAGALTAQQIVEKALEFTGTTVTWNINDWLVPAGVWSFQGTPLQAALRVAESVGAVVRSHKTAQQLIFAPRYVHMPWEWGDVTANIEMPAAIIATDALRPEPGPAYNSVFVSGMAQGGRGHVRRTGTAGDVRAEPVTDALITHEVAARQRGRAILGAGGNKLWQDMTLPLLTGPDLPGLFEPGSLLKVNDIGHSWRGLVRSLRLTTNVVGEGAVVVRQSVSVERNA